ncbi:MAG TPA: aminotransferase class III-fold pyridoxal phosphate-dependent enzyme [Methylocella sp.]|nr:aminotransferase class III-fold pyridoxal phosphate-dependent enzyme [Methylocella sp.]
MSGLSPFPSNEPAEPFGPVFGDGRLDFSGTFENARVNRAEGTAFQTGDAAVVPGFAQEASAGPNTLAATLIPASFGDYAFLLPSEAEAWRVAAETIRRCQRIVGRPKRRHLIFCVGASAEVENVPPGLDADDDITILRTDDPGALQLEIGPKTAGFFVAPVRTQNGLEVLAGSLLAGLRETADEYGLVLAFDETFCGLGRTGMMWAHEWTGVTPDLMISTRGLAGSLPLAALVVTQKVARGAPASLPAADQAVLAAGHAVMDDLLSPGFEERVQNRAWYLEDRLASLSYNHRDIFHGQCGIGLMQGLVCTGKVEPMRAKLAERGLLTRAMGPVLGLFPPLTVDESEIDAAVSMVATVCAGDGS